MPGHTLFPDVVERLLDRPPLIVTTAAREFQSRDDARLFTPCNAVGSGPDGLAAIVASGGSVPALPTSSQDIAFIVYTSGTTGVPKGSISTHAAAMHSATMMCATLGLAPGEAILGLAPLFHITGLVCQVLTAFVLAAPLILSYRFEPGVMLDAITEHWPAFSIGAITAYVAIMHHPDAAPGRFDRVRLVYSGGAPVPAGVVA